MGGWTRWVDGLGGWMDRRMDELPDGWMNRWIGWAEGLDGQDEHTAG